MPNPEAAQVQLQEQLVRLLARVGKIEADLRQSHDRDSEEQATERENDEVLEGLDEITRREVTEIRAALTRIANGTYGTCTNCGRAISEERLAALPSTPVCLTCSSASSRIH